MQHNGAKPVYQGPENTTDQCLRSVRVIIEPHQGVTYFLWAEGGTCGSAKAVRLCRNLIYDARGR